MSVFDQVQEARKRLTVRKIPWYLVDPRVSTRLGYWDAFTALAVTISAVFTPYEIAYLPAASSRSSFNSSTH